MTDDPANRRPPLPPPLPQSQPPRSPQIVRPYPQSGHAQPPPLRLDTVRPGIDRPEDRPRTVGRPASRGGAQQPPMQPMRDPSLPPIGQHSRSAPVKRRRPVLKGVLALTALVAVVMGAGIGYLALNPPIELIRNDVIAAVKMRTGRDLVIAGAARLRLFPEVVLDVQDVTLSAAPRMTGAPFIQMAGLGFRLKLLPLLARRIDVDRLVLQKPVIDLRTDEQGRKSWEFADTAPVPLKQYADAGGRTAGTEVSETIKDFIDNASDPANPSPQVKARLQRLDGLSLRDVRIEDGTVRIVDERAGTQREVSAISADIGFKSIASPLWAAGTLVYAAQPLSFDIKLSSLRAILEERPVKVSATVKGQPAEFSYDGTMTARTAAEFEGTLAAAVPSLRGLALWLGRELPQVDGLGPLSVKGRIKTNETSVVMSDATLALDDQTATGMVLLDTSGARPRINANLKFSALDLNRYSLAAGTAQPVRSGAGTAPAGPAAVPGAAQSIEDLINRGQAPQVKGYTRRAGWSSERISLDALSLADVDARISTGRLRYKELQIGPTTVTVALKGRVLRLNFDDVQLYQGRGRGFVQLDATAAVPTLGLNFGLDGVGIGPLLKDAADFDMMQGRAKLTLAIGAQGASEADLIASSNGKVDMAVSDGALTGYNLSGALRGLSKGSLSGFTRSASEKTEFSELAATFTVTNGIATSQDLRLVSPQVAVSGAGQVQMPAQTLDFVVKPRLTASIDGTGGTDAFTGIEVPVRITGPWAQPTVKPDGSVVLKDPGKAIEAAKAVVKQLKDNGTAKKIGDALKGMTSKNDGEGAQTGGSDTAKAKDFFNKLFKQ